MACLAADLATGCGYTAFNSVIPVVLTWSTSAFVVTLSMAAFAASALAFASDLAAAFSSSVKSVRASISSFLAFRASSIACFAAGFACAVGVTESTDIVPVTLAWSTSALVVALSITSFAASALAFASALALAFSSTVRSVRTSISSVLAFRASSMDCLATDLVNASGLTEVTSLVPVD